MPKPQTKANVGRMWASATQKSPAPWFLFPVGSRVLVWWCPGLSQRGAHQIGILGWECHLQPHSTLDLQLPMFPNRPPGLV